MNKDYGNKTNKKPLSSLTYISCGKYTVTVK